MHLLQTLDVVRGWNLNLAVDSRQAAPAGPVAVPIPTAVTPTVNSCKMHVTACVAGYDGTGCT